MPDIEPTDGIDQPDDQSSSEAGASTGSDPAAELEALRKRQSGADKARDIAIQERDAALRRLAELEAGKAPKKGDSGDSIDIEALKQELLTDMKGQTEKALAAQRQEFLSRLYPNATKRFPGLADEAQLAELEEVFGDKPKPVGNNQQRTPSQKSDDEMTAAELAASIKAMDTSNLW